jgi:hypothetical protein
MRKTLPSKLTDGRIRHGAYATPDSYGPCGAFDIFGPRGGRLHIIASYDESWEHVSVSVMHRLPNWDEMCYVKNLFWDEEETVIQFHPPKSEYVNCHANCLHLWKPVLGQIKTPESWRVGPKTGETHDEREAKIQDYFSRQRTGAAMPAGPELSERHDD